MAATSMPFTITSAVAAGYRPHAYVGPIWGAHPNGIVISPTSPQDNSYWIAIISANNPKVKLKEWVVQNGGTVPSGIDTYMADPGNIFIIATQTLQTQNVPYGDFYNFLAKYGGGPELQKLEQLNATLGYPNYGRVSYVLVGEGGPRTPIAPPSYEAGAYSGTQPALLMVSLESMPNGGPPYGISNTYSWM